MKVQPLPVGAMKVQPEPAGAMKVAAVAGVGPVAKEKLEIRQVWAHNVDSEFRRIRQAVEKNPYVAMDTEFPGVIHHSSKPYYALTPTERYASLKANVDALHLIQVGLAFAPSPDSPPAIVFEINLREFDPRVHRHAPESVKLLADHGLDFAAHRAHGVEARVFAAHLMSSGLVCSGGGGGVTWATFHSAYDFGYLLKLLIGRKLPKTLPEFLGLVRVFFGEEVYDVKHMMKRCPWLGGGLDGVAAALGVQREAGRAHQAGSDSALTWDAFRRIREVFFAKEGVRGSAGVLYGLELEGNLIAAAVDEKSKCGAISSAAATGNGKCGAGLVVGGAAATGKGNGGRRAGRKFAHNNNNRAVAALR